MSTNSVFKLIRNTVMGAVLVTLLGAGSTLYAMDPREAGSAAIQKGELPSVVADWIDRIQEQPGGLTYWRTLDGGDFWEVWFNETGCQKAYCADGNYLVRIDKKTAGICYSERAGLILAEPKPTCPPGEFREIRTRSR